MRSTYKLKKACIAGVLCSAMLMTNVVSIYADEVTLGDSNAIDIAQIGQAIQDANSYESLFNNNSSITNEFSSYNYSTGEAVETSKLTNQLGFNEDGSMFYYFNYNSDSQVFTNYISDGIYFSVADSFEDSSDSQPYIFIMPNYVYDIEGSTYDNFISFSYNWVYNENEVLLDFNYSDDGSSYTFDTNIQMVTDEGYELDEFKEYLSEAYGLDYTVDYFTYSTTVDTETNQVTEMNMYYDGNLIETQNTSFNDAYIGISYDDFISGYETAPVNVVTNANLEDETSTTYKVPIGSIFSLGYEVPYYNIYLDKDLTQLSKELSCVVTSDGLNLYLQDSEIDAVTHNEILQTVLDNVTGDMINIDANIDDCQFSFVYDEENSRDLITTFWDTHYYVIDVSDSQDNLLTQIYVSLDATSMIYEDANGIYCTIDFIYYPISGNYATQIFKYCANQLYGDTLNINDYIVTYSDELETVEKNLCYKVDVASNGTSIMSAYIDNSGEYIFIPQGDGSYQTVRVDDMYFQVLNSEDAQDILLENTNTKFTGLPVDLSEYELILSTDENDEVQYQYINDELCYEFSVFAMGATADDDLISMGVLLYVSDTTGNVYKYDAEGDAYVQLEYTLLGDINDNGSVNSADLLILKKYLLGLVDASEVNLDNADVTSDSKVNSADLLMLKKYLLGLVEL